MGAGAEVGVGAGGGVAVDGCSGAVRIAVGVGDGILVGVGVSGALQAKRSATSRSRIVRRIGYPLARTEAIGSATSPTLNAGQGGLLALASVTDGVRVRLVAAGTLRPPASTGNM